jgi:MYXO-CTERM domain-containing protein
MPRLTWLLAALLGLASAAARAATINVAPGDSYTKIEGAKPGDEVVIARGTYGFRVYLTQQAPASNPIVIRAADPTNPPVWDLSAGYVEDAPGSYTAGDRGRGCWQLSGATNIQISGLVITGCHSSDADSAGMRYYEGTSGILLSNVVFRGNDNGLTGGSQSSQITVEFCEFDANGTLLASSSSPSHNIYIYGGDFTLRYSYVHDPVQAQNFHIRAQTAVIEYNWFARAASYAGDLMTDDDYDGSSTFTQSMTLRGNVIVQGTTQSNDSQIVAVYNDAQAAGLTLNVTLLYNTFVGPSGGRASLVHLSNADGTTMNVELDDNLVAGTTNATHVEMTSVGKVTGTHNWLPTGADATGLSATVFGASPGFTNAAAEDYTLAAGSTAIGAAMPPTTGAPDHEYYRDETITRMYRPRASAKDIGAFESTTSGAGVGPDGGVSAGPDGGAATTGAGGNGAVGAGGATGSGGAMSGSAGATGSGGAAVGGGGAKASGSGGGCACTVGPRSDAGLGLVVVSALVLVARRRRSLSRPAPAGSRRSAW